jgi:hypothetical protein
MGEVRGEQLKKNQNLLLPYRMVSRIRLVCSRLEKFEVKYE